MKHLFLSIILIALVISGCQSCMDEFVGSPSGDIVEETDIPWWEDEVEDIEEDIITQEYINECHQSQFFYCPPLSAVWQQEIVMDICQDPMVIISIGECEELFECDPTNYTVEQIECFTEDGYPGYSTVYCDKGYFSQGECITDCFEEICDYLDNDCDGDIDENQLNACGDCGLVAQEVCDGIDNNCNGSIDEGLLQPCATVCGTGYELCVNGNWISCTAPTAGPEVCNAIDDDCDGMTDEELYCKCPPEWIGVLIECIAPPLTCGKGYKTCACADPACEETYITDCAALCIYVPLDGETCEPTLGIPGPEECNNYDDDCDGETDEDLHASCYTGPPETDGVGICMPGSQYCSAGNWGAEDENGVYQIGLCEGEITPKDEDICNNADDDCDGIVDKGQPMDPTDILFIIDWSGSMTEEIDAVIEALFIFSSYYADEGALKWGLVIGPVKQESGCIGVMCQLGDVCYEGICHNCGTISDMLNACVVFTEGEPCWEVFCKYSSYFYAGGDEWLNLSTDFSSFEIFINTLNNAKAMLALNTGKEMLLDAILVAIHNITIPMLDMSFYHWAAGVGSYPELENFSLTWREDAERLIIIFSDEEPQTFLNPNVADTQLAALMATITGLKPYVFSLDPSDWDVITNANGGGWYFLQPDTSAMLGNLLEILDENVCE
jgi:hypothetical protein